MQKHFPGSIWVLQGWQDNPKPGLLEKLDKRYVLVQELFGENTNNWETRKGYEGTPLYGLLSLISVNGRGLMENCNVLPMKFIELPKANILLI